MAGYDGRGARFNIVAVEGNDLAFTVTAVDSNAAAIDLSAATITATVYDGTGAAIDTLTDAVGGAGSNVITVSLTDTEVDALVDPKSWALVVVRGGDARTWLAGSFTVSDAARARGGTSGTALTATVDSDVSVTVSVNAIGGSGGASALDDLTDVTITTPTTDNVLKYNGSVWVNGTVSGNGDLLSTNNLSDVANAATARTNLGLAIGTNVQAYDADLTTIAAANNGTVLAATTASFLTADETKLDGIATGATTDATVNAHIADTSDAHDASAISVADVATQYTATDVEAALAEVKVIADAAVTPAEAAAAYQPLDADLTDIAAIADVQGDIIVRGASGWERLAKSATSTDVLTAGASQPTWAAASSGGALPAPRFAAIGGVINYTTPGLIRMLFTEPVYTMTNGVTVYTGPYYVGTQVTVDRILFKIQALTGTANIRFAFIPVGSDGQPGTLTYAVAEQTYTTTGQKIVTFTGQDIAPGAYFVGVKCDNSTTAMSGMMMSSVLGFVGNESGYLMSKYYTVSETYGAFASDPADYTSSNQLSTGTHPIPIFVLWGLT